MSRMMGLVFWWVFIASEKDLSHLPKHTRSEDPKAVFSPRSKGPRRRRRRRAWRFQGRLGASGVLIGVSFQGSFEGSYPVRVPLRVPQRLLLSGLGEV